MNPYVILAAIVAIGLSGFAGYQHGRNMEKGAQARIQYDAAIAYANEIVSNQNKVDALSADLEKARQKKQARDRVILKEVIRYESLVPADRRVVLDGTWRVLHDSAATGLPATTGAAGLSSGTAEPVADSAALETVAENYADCREWRDQVTGWQRYYAGLKAKQGAGK